MPLAFGEVRGYLENSNSAGDRDKGMVADGILGGTQIEKEAQDRPSKGHSGV